MKSDCVYCEKGNRLNGYAVEILQLQESIVYIHRDRTYPCRCVAVLKEHKAGVYNLDEPQYTQFFKEVRLIAQAVQKAFNADNVNIALYGDTVDHIHCHIAPKFKDGPQWGTAFVVDCTHFGQTPDYMSDEEIEPYKLKVLAELKKLI